MRLTKRAGMGFSDDERITPCDTAGVLALVVVMIVLVLVAGGTVVNDVDHTGGSVTDVTTGTDAIALEFGREPSGRNPPTQNADI